MSDNGKPKYVTERSGGFKDGEVVDSSPIVVDLTKVFGDEKEKWPSKGYIKSDDGTITVKFNTGADIYILVNEELDVSKHLNDYPLEKIEIKTDSNIILSYRLLLL